MANELMIMKLVADMYTAINSQNLEDTIYAVTELNKMTDYEPEYNETDSIAHTLTYYMSDYLNDVNPAYEYALENLTFAPISWAMRWRVKVTYLLLREDTNGIHELIDECLVDETFNDLQPVQISDLMMMAVRIGYDDGLATIRAKLANVQ